jgi:hypothetical protein
MYLIDSRILQNYPSNIVISFYSSNASLINGCRLSVNESTLIFEAFIILCAINGISKQTRFPVELFHILYTKTVGHESLCGW